MGSQSGLVSFFVVTFGVSRLLTVGFGCGGGVLERLEGLVRLETLGEVLRALRTDGVVVEAANGGRIAVSAAADSWESGAGRRTRGSGGRNSS